MVTSSYIFTPEDLQQTPTDEREHAASDILIENRFKKTKRKISINNEVIWLLQNTIQLKRQDKHLIFSGTCLVILKLILHSHLLGIRGSHKGSQQDSAVFKMFIQMRCVYVVHSITHVCMRIDE